MSIQDELNRLAGTTGRSRQDAANLLASTSSRLVQDALNIYAGTSGLSIQGALNAKAGTIGLSSASAAAAISGVLVPHWSDGLSVGNLDASANWQEMSGLATPNLAANSAYLWVISDSAANMVAMVKASDATNQGVLTLTGQTAMVDLEDIESSSVGGVNYLYAMDFGNNGNGVDSRGAGIDLRIFRIVEPTITGSNISTSNFIEINCAFPAGNLPTSRDCEASIVDENGKIWIITKRDATQKVYSLAHSATYTGTQTLVYEGAMTSIPASTTVALGATPCYAVDAAMNKLGTEILVKNYSDIYYFSRDPDTQTVIQALQGTATAVPAYAGGGSTSPKTSHPNAEPQGEGICYSYDGRDLYSTSEFVSTEGSSASQYPLFKYVRCSKVPTTISFQDGVAPTAGYAGTLDTTIWDTNPTTSYGTDTTFVVDTAIGVESDQRKGLLRFDLSSIPSNATVVGAKLDLWIAAEGQGFKMHKMLVNWDESSTYNSLGPGVNNDDVTASSVIDCQNAINLDTIVSVNLRNNMKVATVQSWVTNPATNYGWMFEQIDSSTGDGLQFDSRQSITPSRRPKLTVRYVV